MMLEALERIRQALGDEVFVVACFDQYPFSLACALMGSCPPELIEEFEGCIALCTQETIETIVGAPLTDDCGACYGPNAACNITRCATASCSSVPTSAICVACRCDEGCPQDFALCSGLIGEECD